MATEQTLKNVNILSEAQFKALGPDKVKTNELYLVPLSLFTSDGKLQFPSGKSLGIDSDNSIIFPDGTKMWIS